jgi:deoxyribodipyrimidine photolyase-related protein
MQAYKKELELCGHTVRYLPIQELKSTVDVFKRLKADAVTHLHIVDTTDYWLEKRIAEASATAQFTITRYESPLFILSKEDAVLRYRESKKHMARFYKKLRIDKKILTTKDDEPVGGKWSFDEDNRKKIPKNETIPADITVSVRSEAQEALVWLSSVQGEHYGANIVWIPWTREEAQAYLKEFLTERFYNFGTYEDAILTNHVRLFHSTLSPLLNIGLLTPMEVVSAAIEYGNTHNVAINNIEGFVRQILGWREFIRASYECDSLAMRTKNFWEHKRRLPQTFWTGTTGVEPLDISIKNALAYGYTHHIERLMVLGNFMLLAQIHPDEVYRWFMAMYIDAYDWVMVPNVYGMSQFADGGTFATKPYISGSNYLKKISNYSTGEWEELWTALYWNFIEVNKKFFVTNHRLSMMPRLLDKMNVQKKADYAEIARKYLGK